MTYRPTVRAANGIVASGHHLATIAGVDALRDGGSAADAAIAAAAVCAVVLPHRTSIGGDVFALAYDARTRHTNADYSERMSEDELKESAIFMAVFAYDAAMDNDRVPRAK